MWTIFNEKVRIMKLMEEITEKIIKKERNVRRKGSYIKEYGNNTVYLEC